MKEFLILLFIFTLGLSLKSQNIEGDWSGSINLGQNKLTIVFHISKNQGKLISIMDSPDQGAFGLKTTSTQFKANKLEIIAKDLGLKFKGEYHHKDKKIKGAFMQGALNTPLVLVNKKVAKPLRPQEPKTFNYRVEEVVFVNKRDKIKLSGTLTLPSNFKPKHIAIMISGSGASDRNESAFDHKPFLVWSNYLTKNGIGVLRFDDRGVGKSEGKQKGATSLDFSYDAEAAFAYLKARNDLKDAKIGFIGHSEGGMIAPLVASRNAQVDFIVLLAGPGVPIAKLLIQQKKDIAKLNGVPTKIMEEDLHLTNQIIVYLNKHNNEKDKDKIKQGLRKIVTTYNKTAINKFGEKETQKTIRIFSSDWIRYFVYYKPQIALAKVKCPVLALNGSLDCQVNSSQNLNAIKDVLTQNKHTKFKILEIKGLNHLLQEAKTGAVIEYRKIEQTISPKALSNVKKWMLNL